MAEAGASRVVPGLRIAGHLRAVDLLGEGRHPGSDHHLANGRHRRDREDGHRRRRRATAPPKCHRRKASPGIGRRPRNPVRMGRAQAARSQLRTSRGQQASCRLQRMRINRRRAVHQRRKMHRDPTRNRRKTTGSRRRAIDPRTSCRSCARSRHRRTTWLVRRRHGLPGRSTYGRGCCSSMRTAMPSSAIPTCRSTLPPFRS